MLLEPIARSKYDAFVLRLWHSDTPPHCRITVTQIDGQQSWHFATPEAFKQFIEGLNTLALNSAECVNSADSPAPEETLC